MKKLQIFLIIIISLLELLKDFISVDIAPFTISLKWNGLYSLLYFAAAMVFIYTYWLVVI